MSKRQSPEPSSSTADQEQKHKKLKDLGQDSTKEETELEEAHLKTVEVEEGATVAKLEQEEERRKENDDRETEKKESMACEEVGAAKQGKVEEVKEEVDIKKGEGCPGEENAANAEEEEEEEEELAKPVGTVVRSSGRGRNKMLHYAAFEIHEKVIELEEAMLLVPEQPATKPYIGILKDVKAKADGGNVTVLVQWLYRGEEALREEGGPSLAWPARDRELFLSFHCDEVTADAVMHKCVVHYVTPEVDVEEAKARRYGFFVQKVYDVRKKVLWDLADVVNGAAKNGFGEAERKQVERLLRQTKEAWESSTPTTTTTTTQTSPTPV